MIFLALKFSFHRSFACNGKFADQKQQLGVGQTNSKTNYTKIILSLVAQHTTIFEATTSLLPYCADINMVSLLVFRLGENSD